MEIGRTIHLILIERKGDITDPRDVRVILVSGCALTTTSREDDMGIMIVVLWILGIGCVFQLLHVWTRSEEGQTSWIHYRCSGGAFFFCINCNFWQSNTVRMALTSSATNCKGAPQTTRLKHTRSKSDPDTSQIVLIPFSPNASMNPWWYQHIGADMDCI